MSILSLLQVALALLVAAQAPNVPASTRQQALDFAQKSVEIATIEIRSMQTQPSQTPAPAAPTATSQPATEPVLGATTSPVEPAPQNPYIVEITQSIPKTGGVLYFKVKKDGKPIEVIEKLTSNLTNQVFLRLPEDLPPGQGIVFPKIKTKIREI